MVTEVVTAAIMNNTSAQYAHVVVVQYRGSTERTVSDEGPAVIEPSRGWASEGVDNRHSMKGAGAGYREELHTPHFYTDIGIRSLQAETEGSK